MLSQQAFSVITATTARKTLESVAEMAPDLVVLDVHLEGSGNGFEICRLLRQRSPLLPIILMSSVYKTELDRVCGFDGGADDYLIKPFGTRELIARIGARLRRSAAMSNGPQVYLFDSVNIDFRTRIVTRSGKRVLLTRMEYALLECLVNRKGEVVSREDLLRIVWGHLTPARTRTVDTHVLELRKKLEIRPDEPVHFRSVRGLGYQFI